MMRRIILLLPTTVVLGLSACDDGGKLDKYVYISGGGVLHTDKSCQLLAHEKYGEADVDFMEFVDTCVIRRADYNYCKKCVSDAQYEHIKSLAERNINKPIKLNMRNVRKLYYRICDSYNDMGSLEIFCQKLTTSGREGIRKRKYLYETLKEDGLIDDVNFNDFDNKIVIYEE